MKPKNKSKNETEHLNGLVRQLKKQLKRLVKENLQLRKELNKSNVEHSDYDIDEQEEDRVSQDKCPMCKGKLNSIDLGLKVVISCKECGYRETKQ